MVVGAARSSSSSIVGMCSGSSSRRSSPIERLRRPTRTTPSWTSTGTPSRVSQTSLSSPVAPSASASSNASRVFSGACALAPRWANVMGRSRSDGSRCCTSADHGRPFRLPACSTSQGASSSSSCCWPSSCSDRRSCRRPCAGRAHVRRAEEDGQQLPDRDAQRPRRADEGDPRHGRPAPQGRRRHRRDRDHRHPHRGQPESGGDRRTGARGGGGDAELEEAAPDPQPELATNTSTMDDEDEAATPSASAPTTEPTPAPPAAPTPPVATPIPVTTAASTDEDLINRTLSGD